MGIEPMYTFKPCYPGIGPVHGGRISSDRQIALAGVEPTSMAAEEDA